MSLPFATVPPASFHIGSDEIAFADNYEMPGLRMKLLQADVEAGFFVVRICFAPGIQLPPHKHTGVAHAFTLSGEWNYLEYAETSPPNRSGSYLFEPAGSTHTLKVAGHNMTETDAVFIVYGAMLIMDDAGAVIAVNDAESMLRNWPAALAAQGKAIPNTLIVGGQTRYNIVEA